MKLLIVEDDLLLQEGLALALSNEGYALDCAATAAEADALIQSGEYSLVILDLGLPDKDGATLLSQWRRRGVDNPVLILTARDAIEDRINGLDSGADDYLAKPFSVQELIARIKALFRRQQAMGQAQTDGHIQAHGLTIDPLARSVLLHGQVVDLTPREFELLYFFARHPGEVFSRLALLEQVWGYQHEGYEHTVNTHINRLRIKIEKDAAEPEIIRTVWGKGYKFAEPHHDAPL